MARRPKTINISVDASQELRDALRKSGARVAPAARVNYAAALTCTLVGADAAEISITWVDDDAIAQMNREYLQHEGPTDVISFELYERGELPVGDIYVGYEQAARQAASYGASLETELIRLAVHGTLHVLGFEHPEDEDRTDSVMWMLQEAIVDEVLTTMGGDGGSAGAGAMKRGSR